MDPETVSRIAAQVYKKFPDVKGKKPRIRAQNANGGAKSKKQTNTFLLTFRGFGSGPGGKKIPRLVRVVASNNGKILKVSTSRG